MTDHEAAAEMLRLTQRAGRLAVEMLTFTTKELPELLARIEHGKAIEVALREALTDREAFAVEHPDVATSEIPAFVTESLRALVATRH